MTDMVRSNKVSANLQAENERLRTENHRLVTALYRVLLGDKRADITTPEGRATAADVESQIRELLNPENTPHGLR